MSSDYGRRSVEAHERWRGKIEVIAKAAVQDMDALSLAYTPGVAEPCLEIAKNPMRSYDLTRRANLCLVVTDGTAVLGLGDIGPLAAMPVMEGKCALFKSFGDVDAFPLCLNTKNADEIVSIVAALSGSFGGINLEDIAAPRCFEIERKLKEICDIPIFHDDQHGTAIVSLAGLINAAKYVQKELTSLKVVINGAGAAAIAITRLLLSYGIKDIVICDRSGILGPSRQDLVAEKAEMVSLTNPRRLDGDLTFALKGADAFIGVSAAHTVTKEMAEQMAKNAIVMACANPVPEIEPEDAIAAGAAVVATGRSDYPNQINNVLAFPGVFRGTFDVRASDINEPMKIAAAHAISSLVSQAELEQGRIVPEPFDPRVAKTVAAAVAKAAKASGVARLV